MAVNHHLRLALDQVSDAVIMVENAPLTGPGPKVLYANEAMAAATGVSAERVCEVPLGALCEGEILISMLRGLAHASQGAAGAVETVAALNHLEGSPTLCRWSAVAVRDRAGQPVNFILTATPERPRGETPAPAPRAETPPAVPLPLPQGDEPPPSPDKYQADLVETIRDTARYVAHEFNNALTAILLPVQVAIRQVPDGGDLHGKLQVAYESARRAADLAKDFLDCFRPRQPVRERYRMDSLLGRAMRLATCAQNVVWSLEVAEDLYEADIDLNQIERVIFNLVRNSCQAMPNGGRLLVKATNTMVQPAEDHALKPGPYVHISVRDWGPGIPEAHMPHLFHSCFTTKENGNGCGLPICYQIVRDHGGEMYVKSRMNVGTAFFIFLPAAGAEASLPDARETVSPVPAPGQRSAGEYPQGTGRHQGNIAPGTSPAPRSPVPSPAQPRFISPGGRETMPSMLVIDDEDGVRRALQQIGQVYGFEVMAVATSEEGLQCYRDRLHARRRYDVVLVDLNLRGSLNGVEVFEALRRIDPDVPAIATSGQYGEGDLERFREIGFAGFLPKPFTLEDFDQIVQEVLVTR